MSRVSAVRIICLNKQYGIITTWMLSFISWIASQLALFTASFETNPLDGKCDQRVTVKSQPVKVVYDAVSSKIF